jgi:hypothetical protein
MPHYVYRYYDSADRLLYVGYTHSFSTRASAHERDAVWWPDVVTVKLERFPDEISGRAAEKHGIIGEGPLHNIIHAVVYEKVVTADVVKLPWSVEKSRIRKRLRAEGRL